MNEIIEELTATKRLLRESEDLRKSLVRTVAASVEQSVAVNERLIMYQDVIDAARTLRDSETGSVNIENMLFFFETLDKIPVPS